MEFKRELEERLGDRPGQRQESTAFGEEDPLGHQRVDVRVRRDELAEGLNGAGHSGHGVARA